MVSLGPKTRVHKVFIKSKNSLKFASILAEKYSKITLAEKCSKCPIIFKFKELPVYIRLYHTDVYFLAPLFRVRH